MAIISNSFLFQFTAQSLIMTDFPIRHRPRTRSAHKPRPGRGGVGIISVYLAQKASRLPNRSSALNLNLVTRHYVPSKDARRDDQSTWLSAAIPLGKLLPQGGRLFLNYKDMEAQWLWTCCWVIALALGARFSRPGEFSERAFDETDKMDLTKRKPLRSYRQYIWTSG